MTAVSHAEAEAIVERVKMALADVPSWGMDPAKVRVPPPKDRALGAAWRCPTAWPAEKQWRAREAALAGGAPTCFSCYQEAQHRINAGLPTGPCDATRRFLPDCGRTR